MREYSSREIPSGFRAGGWWAFLSCEGPAEALLSGRERALLISAEETAMADDGKQVNARRA
jgi:hypothetical protein